MDVSTAVFNQNMQLISIVFNQAIHYHQLEKKLSENLSENSFPANDIQPIGFTIWKVLIPKIL